MSLYSKYRRWSRKNYRGGEGILVGADLSQEWLLPWWWDHYSRHNNYPITWIDLGLSEGMRDWCRERGELLILRIADIFVLGKEEIEPEISKAWEEEAGTSFWEGRNAWFKKPFAILQTPYEKTLWFDADCEIRGSVGPIFEFSHLPQGIAVRKKPCGLCNTGVVSYRWGNPLPKIWADKALFRNGEFLAGDYLLTQIISEEKIDITPLPDVYNRLRTEQEEGAVVFHWTGIHGKATIRAKLIQERLSW